MSEIPPPWAQETPSDYARRLLGLLAKDEEEAAAAWSLMHTWEVPLRGPDGVVDDVERALRQVRDTPAEAVAGIERFDVLKRVQDTPNAG